MRKDYDGFPSRSDLAVLRKAGSMPKIDEGISSDELIDALHTYHTPLTGIHYTQTNPEHGFARGQSWRHLNAVE